MQVLYFSAPFRAQGFPKDFLTEWDAGTRTTYAVQEHKWLSTKGIWDSFKHLMEETEEKIDWIWWIQR